MQDDPAKPPEPVSEPEPEPPPAASTAEVLAEAIRRADFRVAAELSARRAHRHQRHGAAHSSGAATNMGRLSPIRRACQIPPLPGPILTRARKPTPISARSVRSLIKQFMAPNTDMSGVALGGVSPKAL
jgi:hypothetical protein